MTYIVLIFCIIAFLFFLEIRFKNELIEVEKELNKIKSEIEEIKNNERIQIFSVNKECHNRKGRRKCLYGWYQIKDLVKEYIADEMKEFKVLYNKLAEKMKPMIMN